MSMASPEKSLLPIDIIEEIFCNIPIEYLSQFKSTCKQWQGLLKDKRFVYKYLDLVEERFIRIDHTVQIINPVIGARSSSPIPEEFNNVTEMSTVLHCDGLLVCRCNNTRSNNCKLAVWNPFLKRIKWIKAIDFYSSNDSYGIGYDNGSNDRDYKILRIFDGEVEDESDIFIGSHEPVIQMYDFKSDSWRVVVDGNLEWSIDPPCKGVSLKGNMYWVAHWNDKLELFIQSFDFSTETFKPLCEIPFQCGVLDTVALSSFRGDRLSLLYQRGEEATKIEIWVTNRVNDEVVSLTKYFEVISPDLPTLHNDQDLARPSYFIGEDDSVMVWCEEAIEDERDESVCVGVYEISKYGIVKKQVESGRCDLNCVDGPFVCSYAYVPSLVPVPE